MFNSTEVRDVETSLSKEESLKPLEKNAEEEKDENDDKLMR